MEQVDKVLAGSVTLAVLRRRHFEHTQEIPNLGSPHRRGATPVDGGEKVSEAIDVEIL